MQIFQHHTTAKDKNLYMGYKNIILGEKKSIVSSHSNDVDTDILICQCPDPMGGTMQCFQKTYE